jgi:hypothetical protein
MTYAHQALESTRDQLFPSQVRIDKCELANGNLLDATIFEFRAWANSAMPCGLPCYSRRLLIRAAFTKFEVGEA